MSIQWRLLWEILKRLFQQSVLAEATKRIKMKCNYGGKRSTRTRDSSQGGILMWPITSHVLLDRAWFFVVALFLYLFAFNFQFYEKQKEKTWSKEKNARKAPSLPLSNRHRRLCIPDNWHTVTVWGSWLHNRTDRHWWWLQRSRSS